MPRPLQKLDPALHPPYDLLKILRQAPLERPPAPPVRVLHLQPPRVQHEPLPGPRAPVRLVADDGAAEVGEVDADLVRPAGQDLHLEQGGGGRRVMEEGFDVRDGLRVAAKTGTVAEKNGC